MAATAAGGVVSRRDWAGRRLELGACGVPHPANPRAQSLPVTKPPEFTPERQEQLRRLVATGEPVRELADAFGIGRATAYRYLSLGF